MNTENMNPKTLSKWSIWVGFLGVILYVIAFILLWQGDTMIADRFDNKDLYFAGSGLLYIAIWFKLGAIYHKGSQQGM